MILVYALGLRHVHLSSGKLSSGSPPWNSNFRCGEGERNARSSAPAVFLAHVELALAPMTAGTPGNTGTYAHSAA